MLDNLSEYDLAIVSGHASHPDVLKKAGIDSDTLLISVTYVDEVNIVACQIAKQIFDVKNSMNSKKSYGGTSSKNVRNMIKRYKKDL